jgi:hypothetical protein
MNIKKILPIIKEHRMLTEINNLNKDSRRYRELGMAMEHMENEAKIIKLFNELNEKLQPFNKRVTVDRPIIVSGLSITKDYNYIIEETNNNVSCG